MYTYQKGNKKTKNKKRTLHTNLQRPFCKLNKTFWNNTARSLQFEENEAQIQALYGTRKVTKEVDGNI